MHAHDHAQPRCANRLLRHLAADERDALLSLLSPVDLKLREIVAERGSAVRHVYFPCSAILSVLSVMANGDSVEVGTIGNDGFYGIDPLVGIAMATETTLCQMPGTALRMSVADFRNIVDGDTPLRRLLQRYMLAYLSLVSQSAACNRLHVTEARFARWILMTHDRVEGDDFMLTQEFLSQMLGVHRPSVSVVANAFQQAGLIRYNRGHMSVLDRAGLEASACECYAIVNRQFEQILGAHAGG
jgi:CRP-like cAMP-binding protein